MQNGATEKADKGSISSAYFPKVFPTDYTSRLQNLYVQRKFAPNELNVNLFTANLQRAEQVYRQFVRMGPNSQQTRKAQNKVIKNFHKEV